MAGEIGSLLARATALIYGEYGSYEYARGKGGSLGVTGTAEECVTKIAEAAGLIPLLDEEG